MSVFVSHVCEDMTGFGNITDALAMLQATYWTPAAVQPGAPLLMQLCEALKLCPLPALAPDTDKHYFGAALESDRERRYHFKSAMGTRSCCPVKRRIRAAVADGWTFPVGCSVEI
jgi:hypothetical protein